MTGPKVSQSRFPWEFVLGLGKAFNVYRFLFLKTDNAGLYLLYLAMYTQRSIGGYEDEKRTRKVKGETHIKICEHRVVEGGVGDRF